MNDWLKFIEENKELLLLLSSFLLLFPSSLIVYFTCRSVSIAKKQMKENLPTIANVARRDKNEIKIIITNNKSGNITIRDIEMKKKKGLRFLKVKSTWKPEKTSISKSAIPGMSIKNIYHFVIKDQEDFYITIPNLEEKAIYKICVETTGGSCHHISKLPLGVKQ